MNKSSLLKLSPQAPKSLLRGRLKNLWYLLLLGSGLTSVGYATTNVNTPVATTQTDTSPNVPAGSGETVNVNGPSTGNTGSITTSSTALVEMDGIASLGGALNFTVSNSGTIIVTSPLDFANGVRSTNTAGVATINNLAGGSITATAATTATALQLPDRSTYANAVEVD